MSTFNIGNRLFRCTPNQLIGNPGDPWTRVVEVIGPGAERACSTSDILEAVRQFAAELSVEAADEVLANNELGEIARKLEPREHDELMAYVFAARRGLERYGPISTHIKVEGGNYSKDPGSWVEDPKKNGMYIFVPERFLR